MRKAFTLLFTCSLVGAQAQDALRILSEVDKNISADSRIIESTMIVHGKRNDRTLTSKSYTMGDKKSFSEYLSPARDKGTKMLKLDTEMWVYTPSTDRTIMISGHLLRQSVMGSDLSYEDMMDDRKLQEIYTPQMAGEEMIEGRKCHILHLQAKVTDAAYESQKIWVDAERMIPLKQELYAKSGQLLKRILLSNVQQIQGRWFPLKMNYKDMLKEGEGTDWIIASIQFNQPIPDYIFSKASLKQ
ncbi:MAG: outer membrane lipoprotein-sorting protein [Bacteroidetes bacterium]|nr:outer membrane lipoprotein-sorting protein [Bacteroidota bacterium]